MSSIGQRIRYLRKEYLGKTQKDFGAIIGLKPNSVSDIESGKNKPTEQTIKAIVRDFNVNENWLRTGEGTPDAVDSQEERYTRNLAKLQRTDDETIINWVNMIAESNPEALAEIEAFFKSLLGIKK